MQTDFPGFCDTKLGDKALKAVGTRLPAWDLERVHLRKGSEPE